jgi:hypothetical protein
MVSKRKLGSTEIERQLALGSDSDGYSRNLFHVEKRVSEEDLQPGTNAGGPPPPNHKGSTPVIVLILFFAGVIHLPMEQIRTTDGTWTCKTQDCPHLSQS